MLWVLFNLTSCAILSLYSNVKSNLSDNHSIETILLENLAPSHKMSRFNDKLNKLSNISQIKIIQCNETGENASLKLNQCIECDLNLLFNTSILITGCDKHITKCNNQKNINLTSLIKNESANISKIRSNIAITCSSKDECFSGKCCDMVKCKFLSARFVCRKASDCCDVEEVCSGSSSICPTDDYIRDGENCMMNGSNGVCIEGSCFSATLLCKAVHPLFRKPTKACNQFFNGEKSAQQCSEAVCNVPTFLNDGFESSVLTISKAWGRCYSFGKSIVGLPCANPGEICLNETCSKYHNSAKCFCSGNERCTVRGKCAPNICQKKSLEYLEIFMIISGIVLPFILFSISHYVTQSKDFSGRNKLKYLYSNNANNPSQYNHHKRASHQEIPADFNKLMQMRKFRRRSLQTESPTKISEPKKVGNIKQPQILNQVEYKERMNPKNKEPLEKPNHEKIKTPVANMKPHSPPPSIINPQSVSEGKMESSSSSITLPQILPSSPAPKCAEMDADQSSTILSTQSKSSSITKYKGRVNTKQNNKSCEDNRSETENKSENTINTGINSNPNSSIPIYSLSNPHQDVKILNTPELIHPNKDEYANSLTSDTNHQEVSYEKDQYDGTQPKKSIRGGESQRKSTSCFGRHHGNRSPSPPSKPQDTIINPVAASNGNPNCYTNQALRYSSPLQYSPHDPNSSHLYPFPVNPGQPYPQLIPIPLSGGFQNNPRPVIIASPPPPLPLPPPLVFDDYIGEFVPMSLFQKYKVLREYQKKKEHCCSCEANDHCCKCCKPHTPGYIHHPPAAGCPLSPHPYPCSHPHHPHPHYPHPHLHHPMIMPPPVVQLQDGQHGNGITTITSNQCTGCGKIQPSVIYPIMTQRKVNSSPVFDKVHYLAVDDSDSDSDDEY